MKEITKLSSILTILLLQSSLTTCFLPLHHHPKTHPTTTFLHSSTTQSQPPAPDYNAIHVPKTGTKGETSVSQTAILKDLSLGAPQRRPSGGHYLTKGGVQVTAHVLPLEFSNALSEGTSTRAIEDLVEMLDENRGVLLCSSYEFPGRYARWSLGFVNPPLEISGSGQRCTITALNERGEVLLPAVLDAMQSLKREGLLSQVNFSNENHGNVDVVVIDPPPVGTFKEEERSKQPSLFSVVRSLINLFHYSEGDGQLGLYGAFGYDLTFQFEPIRPSQSRDVAQRDLLLYLPDEIVVVDQDKHDAWRLSYDFAFQKQTTQGLPKKGSSEPFEGSQEEVSKRDTPHGEFAESVERAKREFAVGNLFEVVLSQTFREPLPTTTPPSVLYKRLRARNPSPYGFFMNLGLREYLVGASPEMFVRCEAIMENEYRVGALRVETCPISGTVARGKDALEDARNVKSLMMNKKEESELTMCTDVDRNDKSRICEPGSVKVIGRRQIEMYSRLIHTVDHVEGYLRPEFDALDAFLCHTWAVTVTGAPKTWAIQFIEDVERTPRCWYGGAVGMVGFDGGLNTGLTLRTIRIKDGVAEVRAGATLLYDSSPPAEELETELKASAMLDAIIKKGPEDDAKGDEGLLPQLAQPKQRMGDGKTVILIDHEDSFVHTLGNYLRQTGAEVMTLRSGPSALKAIEEMVEMGNTPDMVVLSPGPGNPSDFGLSQSISLLIQHNIPIFGVCLGLQGIVEYFDGKLGVLGYPMHGKPSSVSLTTEGKKEHSIFAGLPDTFEVARYHSLYGIRSTLPSSLDITAVSDDGIVMGIQHQTLPIAAVQFHPESILTSPSHGMTILKNTLRMFTSSTTTPPPPMERMGELSNKTTTELKQMLQQAKLSVGGTKTDLVVRLTLWRHTQQELMQKRLVLDDLTVVELRELKRGIGLRGTKRTKRDLVESLKECFLVDLF